MNLNTARDIGGLVRQTRKDRGMTQLQLADQVGVSRDWIIRLEQGRGTIELALVLRTLKALELTLQAEVRRESQGDGFDWDEILRPTRGDR